MRLNPPLRKALRYDATSSTVQYVGEAPISSSESSAVWKIFRLTYVGDSITIEWADGDDLFNNVWADRATLSYS